MKKTLLIITLALCVFMLISCTGDMTSNPSNNPQSQENLIKNRNRTLVFIKDNSSLPCMPGDSFESIDTDGYEAIKNGDDFVYTNGTLGITYIFSGASDPQGCSLTSVKLEKPSYAIFGFSAGDKASEANLILTASGFSVENSNHKYVFSKDSVYITVEYSDNEITSIAISI